MKTLPKLTLQTPRRLAALALPIALTLTVSPLTAQDAQPAAETAEQAQASTRPVVVLQGPAPLRSGDQEIFYTITEVPAGAILQAAEQSGRYTRVAYPDSIGVFVPSYSGTLTSAGDQVELTEESRLRARSMLGGVEGSWSPVYLRKLPVGTTLSLIETIRDDDGTVLAYRVEPLRPPQTDQIPSAFILTETIRDATPDEIANAPAVTAVSPPVETPAVQVADTDNTTQANQEPADSAAEQAQDTPVEITNAATDPVSSGSEQAVSDELIDPIVLPDPSSKGGPNTNLSAASIESLDAAFNQARTLPRAQLDEALNELLAEYTRAIATESDEWTLASLNQRADWLRLRIDSRDQRRAIESALASADVESTQLTQRITEWNASRAYVMVGRITASSVYNGENLPRLFRVRVPDAATGIERTIGYVDPSGVPNAARLLGELVGIAGDPVRDDALSTVVVRASRIERLNGSPSD